MSEGGYRCHLCGRDDFVVPSLLRLHIEHDHPLSTQTGGDPCADA